MKNVSMITKPLILSVLAALAVTTSARAQIVEDPFAAGTGVAVGTVSVERDIHEFAMQSRALLEQALLDTERARPQQAVPTLLGVMQDVVLRSFQYSRGKEMLFRNVINQALELVGGLPAFGERPARPGILDGHLSIELTYEILRDTVRAAIHLTDQDASAPEVTIQTDAAMITALDLPYIPFASVRIGLAGVIWASAVRSAQQSMRNEYVMLQTILQQWVNIVMAPSQLEIPAVSALVVRTRRVLCDTSIQPCAIVEAGRDSVSQEVVYNRVRPAVTAAQTWAAVDATPLPVLQNHVFRMRRHIQQEMVVRPAFAPLADHITRYHPFRRSSDFHAWMDGHWDELVESASR